MSEAGPEDFRVNMSIGGPGPAASGIHGVNLRISALFDHCVEHMGPESRYRSFIARDAARKLPLEGTYPGC